MGEAAGGGLRQAAWWSYAGSLYLTAGQFVLGIVLARILGPADFGVFIAVTAYTSLLLLGAQLGFPQALLQARTLTPAAIDAVFWTITSLTLLAVLAAWLLSAQLAVFYDAAAFRPVLLATSLGLLLMPYTAVGFALLRREMRFAEVARMNILAFNASAVVSLAAALSGLGVYSLVLAGIVSMAVNGVSIFRALRWRPGRPALRPVMPLLHYARYAAVNSLIGASASRIDNMIIGALLGAAHLGLYNRAYSLARIPTDQFGESLGPLLLGALARIQDDAAASRAQFFKALTAICVVTFPMLALLLVAGPLAIELLYGSAWAGAGMPVQVMALGGMALAVAVSLRGVVNAQGLVRQLAVANLVTLGLTVIAVIALAPWGLVAIAAGISLREAVMTLWLHRLVARSQLAVRPRETLHALLPPLSAAAIGVLAGSVVAWVLPDLSGPGALLRLAGICAAILVCFAAALGLLARLWRSHRPLRAVADLATESLGRVDSRVARWLRQLLAL